MTMTRILHWIEEHKLESGALAAVVIVALYLLLRKSGGGAAPAAQASSTGSDYYSAQLQLDQLQAQQGAVAAQANVQMQTATLAAQVQNNQTQAQLQAQEDQYAAAIQAAEIQAGVTNTQTGAQVQVAGIQADVANNQTNAAVQENHDNLEAITGLVSSQNQVEVATINAAYQTTLANDQTAVAINGQQYDYANNVAQLEASLAHQHETDTTQLDQQAIANIKNVNGSQNRVAIIGAALNQQGTAIAAEQGQTASSISGDQLLGGIASTVGKVFTGLFT
jgi:hypothetical protein